MSDAALQEFFSEGEEIVQRFSSNLTALEKGEAVDPGLLDALYRDMHTLKGTSLLFGFQQLGQLGHAMETALEPVRRLKLKPNRSFLDVLFHCLDLIDQLLKSRELLATVQEKFKETLMVLIPQLLSEATQLCGQEMLVSKESSSGLIADLQVELRKFLAQKSESTISLQGEQPSENFPVLDNKNQNLSSSKKNDFEEIQKKILKEEIEKKSQRSSPMVNQRDASPVSKEETGVVSPTATEAQSTIRIQVSLLDKLMNLVGELVLVRNQVRQYAQDHEDLDFLNLNQRLDLVTSELQGEVMKTRMQPIGSVLSKFQRMVRDLGRDLKKEIELVIEGADTELDKTLLEAVKDPLTHMIRNACDHGIETPEERLKKGKSETGRVQILAYHEGGQVFIEMTDDGRGLDPVKILNKAIERKILTLEQSQLLAKEEVFQLIFAPGFSTATQVSAVSGRGVGMDVVKTNIEKIGGHVELRSEVNRGMTVRIKIPLTLAIVPALLVRTGKDHFAIPQIKLAELVRVTSDPQSPHIEALQGKPVFRLRGHLLPLVDLSEVLSQENRDKKVLTQESVNIVVLKNDHGESFGLIVDEIRDTADIVVKPLPHFLKKLGLYSGVTIMGDGAVALILDIMGVAHKAHLFQHAHISHPKEGDGAYTLKKTNLENQDFLFFKLSSQEVYCLPLCLVHRLEEFPKKSIEQSGSQRVVQYRKSILPLISLEQALYPERVISLQDSLDHISSDHSVPVIVVQKQNRFFGIEVEEILDVLSVGEEIQDLLKPIPGILGNLVLDHQVVTVVDILTILSHLMGHMSLQEVMQEVRDHPPKQVIQVLLVEDTLFFMKQIKRILEQQGMQVTHALDGLDAWKLLAEAPEGKYQLVLSDIEMPRMNGFELAEKIRSEPRLQHLPLVAITTRFRDQDRELGKKVGFNRYLEKLKSDDLLKTIQELVPGFYTQEVA